ncbi:ABC transporter ATP-binding protein [Collinsella sp. An307]|uniref:ABC transporter ATP-binding protein n=1 Tax=Collinsella sp. An307 TaxID=1965630 RepID=UPI000B37AF0C|nr:ABC transporter ATP-binding protein [Collinsella sp. An307]OUO19013.1 ATP-binding protein [Collinsella sp. An307]
MLKLARRFFGRFRLNLIIGPLCKLIEVVFDVLTPIVVALMIDEGVSRHSLPTVLFYGGVLGVFALVGIAFALVCQKMASRASQGIGTEIRATLYQHINELSYTELDHFGTPSLITRITNDVNQVQLAVALAIRQLIRWPLLAVGSMIAALAIDWHLGLIFLISTPIIAGVFWFVMARCVPFFKELQARLDHIALLTREGLSGVRVIRAFARGAHERERFRRAADDQAAVAIAVGKLSSLLNPVTFLVMNLAVCAILWQGGGLVDTGELSQGEVMAFVNYMTQTLLSIVYVANLVVVFTKASASASRINEVLDCAPTIVDAPDAAVPVLVGPAAAPVLAGPAAVPSLRMANAAFTYPGAMRPAVAGADFSLMPGQTLGIIGGTGSGKSTLVNLIPRLYDATEGTVELFGRDVRTWPLAELRRAVGIVPQKASLVSGTIRSNLTWRDTGASDDELWRALEIAQAADFVRANPKGLDAPVEAAGKNFSGGQRQRLTIARALVGDPAVLILDDSASALDFKTDAALRHAIHVRSREGAVAGGVPLTTVIVSQRISSVREADLICVMRRGQVVGLGTHDELMRACTVYQEIFYSQFKREEAEGATPSAPLASSDTKEVAENA